MSETAARFLHRFSLPLLAGGRVACGPMLGAKAWEDLCALPAHSVDAQLLHRAMRMRTLTADPVPPADPSDGTAMLLVSAHDLLTSLHPEAGNLLDSTARLIRRHAVNVAQMGWPETLPEALARHAVVDAACRAVREDIHLSWWTGTATFYGTRPPARLSIWPNFRRVRQNTERTPLLRAATSAGSTRVRSARRLLLEQWSVASPLTPLLLGFEDAWPLPLDLRQPALGSSAPTYASLRFVDHPFLRTRLCDLALSTGFVGAVAGLSSAVNALLTTVNPPPWTVARALKLLLSVHHTRLFNAVVEQQSGRAREPVLVPTGLPPAGARLVWGLYLAAREVAVRAGWPDARPVETVARRMSAEVTSPPVMEAAASYLRAAEIRMASSS